MEALGERKRRLALVSLGFLELMREEENALRILACEESHSSDLPLALVKERQEHFRIGHIYNDVWIQHYIDDDFHRLFRMRKDTYYLFVEVVAPFYPEKIVRGDAPIVKVDKAVLLSLAYLAKSDLSMNDCGDKFGVAPSTVYNELNHIVNILNSLKDRFIVWPKDNECNTVRRQFQDRAGFPGVIWAIDGCHIQVLAPADDQDSYTDRKMNHSIIQGICTASKIFTNISVGTPGSRNDCRALRYSSFYVKVNEQGPESLFYGDFNHLIGDKAYPCRTWLMPPYKDYGNLTEKQRKYNKIHSCTRVVIEYTFGLLKGRWRRMLSLTLKEIEKDSSFVVACCVLHNFCYLHKDEVINEMVEEERVFNNDGHEYDDPNNRIRGKAKRDEIADML